jgi:hypothetical protein
VKDFGQNEIISFQKFTHLHHVYGLNVGSHVGDNKAAPVDLFKEATGEKVKIYAVDLIGTCITP